MIIRAILVKIRLNLSTTATSGPGDWDTTHMKGMGMLVVLLREGGFRILVSLRVFLGKTPSLFSREGLV